MKYLAYTTRLLLALFIIATICASCNRLSSSPDGLWFYIYPGDQGAAPTEKSLHAVSFLWLGKDGRYSLDLDGYSSGTWQKLPDALLLRNQAGSLRRLDWRWANSQEIDLKDSLLGSLHLEREPSGFSQDSLSPFSPENNRWRLRATHAESDSELLSRLRNHCRFYELYFRWALENNIRYLDVRSTPSPIRIYGNGLVVKKEEDLPQVWRRYFFDERDCRRASELLSTAFRKNDIAWPATKNKFAMFISAFRQLEDFLQ